MIKIVIYRKKAGNITGFKITGHSGYDTHGKDIVCSAVSSIAQTALLGLLKVAEAEAAYKIEDGYLMCELRDDVSDRKSIMCGAILETMYEGLKNIKESYRKHIDLVEEEV